ncbi:hypothetical protein ASZ90_008237 [hydrocarbon metagenome]|uniref:Uncharacterized protein n=1 Tax=hydrocarbon metagenome TaxID=938273 RepID=A0A0W8FM46_9ZZZZ
MHVKKILATKYSVQRRGLFREMFRIAVDLSNLFLLWPVYLNKGMTLSVRFSFHLPLETLL